ncbi:MULTISPECIES: DUF4304 domain-containing protein [Myroides]|uniref:DUF4304 domain-containing protein n=1 Tax=Myroides profundi TaxID=480520 RepID=A0AAJ5BE35_MYRPR|nr:MULTISPECIES: DUF4304 domain-containing protein [Myroides]AJH14567.1 hypothetical protein MPR_1385 [Myroides profundi]MDM1397792.1 DUF4304 domain-containing protein [Myroides odoratimimus]SEQ92247.1 protein of unknown function [Myroides profundi]
MYPVFSPKLYFDKIVFEYLNSILKSNGFTKGRGNNWTRTNGAIFSKITIQKSKSRLEREVSFRFYLHLCPEGIQTTKVTIDNKEMDWTYNEQAYSVECEDVLSKERKMFKFKNHGWLGWYVIFRENACDQLLNDELKVDFENYILPVINKINTIDIYQKVKTDMNTYPKKDIHLGIYDYLFE